MQLSLTPSSVAGPVIGSLLARTIYIYDVQLIVASCLPSALVQQPDVIFV